MRADVDQLDLGVAGRDLGRRLGDAAGDAADVEGAQGELRARLADGLGGDDADGLADVDQLCPWPGCGRSTWRRRRGGVSQVSTERIFTISTPVELDLLGVRLVDEGARLDDQLARQRVDDVVRRDAAEDAVAQALDDVARPP